MKRALLLILILVNFCLLAWHRWYQLPEEAVVAPAPALSGQPLQLAAELSPEERKDLAAAQAPAATTTTAAVTAPAPGTAAQAAGAVACAAYGPFPSDDAVQQGEARLKPLGFQVSEHLVAGKAKQGYWVYLPPFGSKHEADAAAGLLKRRGVADIYVVTDEANRNAISLGVFSQKSYAADRQRQLRKLGYRALLAERFRDEPRYWLDARGLATALPAADVLKDLSAEDTPVGRALGVCPSGN
ncbi:MAG TPA: SPOR domain-containing protein [Gammaproteobacteria bacterium]|nr:SPOR domain-containing protein [Gammaproteobacteria bacterium]